MFQDGTRSSAGRASSLPLLKLVTLSLLVLLPPQIRAQNDSPSTDQISDRYFSIHEPNNQNSAFTTSSTQAAFSDPTEALGTLWAEGPHAVAAVFSLLDWNEHSGRIEDPPDRYDRRKQFGTWRTNPDDDSCLDSRGLVLQRDAVGRVATRESSDRCVVVGGRWVDPYSGETLTVAKDVDIDHVVPLKNAYSNGAWRWTKEQRCQYFNFTENSYHLRAVGQSENSVKGDSSPMTYIPPLRTAQCEYLRDWLSIKLTWGLHLPADEAEAIRNHIQQIGCNEHDFKLQRTAFDTFRKKITSGDARCGAYKYIPIQKSDF